MSKSNTKYHMTVVATFNHPLTRTEARRSIAEWLAVLDLQARPALPERAGIYMESIKLVPRTRSKI